MVTFIRFNPTEAVRDDLLVKLHAIDLGDEASIREAHDARLKSAGPTWPDGLPRDW